MSLKTAIVQPGMFKTPPFSVEAPGIAKVDGETIPRRNPKCAQGLLSRPEGSVATLFDILLRSREKFGDLDAMGTRELIDTHNEDRKVNEVIDGREVEVVKQWTFFEMGEFRFLTFSQYVDLALQIGAGLRKLGLVRGDRIHIFAATR
jgi:long-chain acyl-CoA synthetase